MITQWAVIFTHLICPAPINPGQYRIENEIEITYT